MEFLHKFDKKLADEQLKESGKLRNRYPDRIPVLVDRARRTDPILDKNKFLVPSDLTVGQLVYTVRKRLTKDLKPADALFFFINNTLVPTSALVSQIYCEHAQNGFLRIVYSTENTFGSCGL